EGASSNGAGHEVRAIEAEGCGALENFSQLAPHRIMIPIQAGVVVGRESTTGLYPTLHRITGREVFNNGAGFWAIVYQSVDVAATQNGLAILIVDRRQIEEIIIFSARQAFGEEGSNEVTLAVEPALRGIVEHGFGSIAKGGCCDGFATA